MSLKNHLKLLLISFLASVLVACGGGGSSSDDDTSSTPSNISVMGSDGPLANAQVKVYKLQDYIPLLRVCQIVRARQMILK